MIVIDASLAVSGLLNDGPARGALGTVALHAPHLIDAEVASGLRRQVSRRRIDGVAGARRLRAWARLAVTRYPMTGLLERVWELRANVSAYDATYVALAEALGCELATADGRLARVAGLRCAVTVYPA